jgi:cardiolipin synthase (CMP-forming)
MRITANQVTLVRLLAMPFMAALVYGDERTRIVGVILGTLVGLTDFVDGRMARKYGVTVLGSLLDPVADKVFIVLCYAPLADRGGIPWWVAAAIVSRELMVTVLRSSLELKGRRLPSTVIAKLKTWVQMLTVAFLVLTPIIKTQHGLSLLYGLPLGVAVLAGIIGRMLLGARWLPLWFAAAALATLTAAAQWAPSPVPVVEVILQVVVVGITWVSAFDYLAVGWKELLGGGAVGHRALHLLRLGAGALLPVVALAAAAAGQVPAVPVFVLLCCEMARGALDNFVAHQRIPDFSWAGSLWAEMALLAAAALVVPSASVILAVAAAAIAVVELGRAYVRHHRGALRLIWRGGTPDSR